MKRLMYLGLIATVISCEPESVKENQIADVTSPEQITGGEVVTVSYAGRDFQVTEVDGAYVYQGDIMIPKESVEVQIYANKESVPQTKAALKTESLWENNTVYYDIDPSLGGLYRVKDAIAHWEANTNIRFVREAHTDGYIYFTWGLGCSSYIGKVMDGRQPVTLNEGCTTGNTIHEIGHAVGMWHEHMRADRDEYVTVHWENVMSGAEHNFVKYTEVYTPDNSVDATAHLDFNSIMLYSSYAFSKNGEPTITKNDGSTFTTNRKVLSEDDIRGVQKIYPESEVPEYENGNYYTVNGVLVYRAWNRWWYYTRTLGWKEVKLSSSGYWYYV